MAHAIYDARGLNCPLPLMHTHKNLHKLEYGDTLEILSTDPCSKRNFTAFCKSSNYKLLESTADGGIFKFVIQK